MNLPWDVLDNFYGFALDGGGTNMKIVYIDKHDWKDEEERREGSYGKMQFKSFPSENLDVMEICEFIKNTAHLNKNVEPPVIYGSGFGTSLIAAELKKQFGVQVHCVDEFSTFSTALVYLAKHLPRREIICNIEPSERQGAFTQGNMVHSLSLTWRNMITDYVPRDPANSSSPEDLWSLQDLDTVDPDKPLADIKDLFPCIIMMCGSGIGAFVVTEDGRCELINILPHGGKYWVGMGDLLTDAENYSQLMQMAEKGDPSKVDLVYADMAEYMREGQTNFYQDWMAETTTSDTRSMQALTKVNKRNKGTLKQEDLIRSTLNSHISNIVYYGFNVATMTQAKHVFCLGGFTDHPLVQKQMFRQWINSWCEVAGFSDRVKPVAIHFLQYGGYFGALGAFLKSVNIPEQRKT